MAKRSCPFSDCRPQLKVHVNERKIANGVLRNELMNAVYDRTRNLLYQGANKCVLLTPSAEFASIADAHGKNPHHCNNGVSAHSWRQITLNQQCQLQPSTFILEDRPASVTCPACHSEGVQVQDVMPCTFCESSLCTNCIVICNRCQEFFCSTCTFNLYDSGESHICRNCC